MKDAILIMSLFINLALCIFLVRTMYLNPPTRVQNNSSSHFYNVWQTEVFSGRPKHPLSILFLGDSHTAHFGVTEYFGPNVLTRGIDGDNTTGILSRLYEISERQPKKLFLQIGINDIIQQVPIAQIQSNYQSILNYVTENSPSTQIYIQTLLPCSWFSNEEREWVKRFNGFLKAEAQKRNLNLIDLYPQFQSDDKLLEKYDSGDQLHLNTTGYDLWASIVKPYVME